MARITGTRALAVVTAAFLLTMLGTTMPTPLYGLYEAELGFGVVTVTVVFAAYAVGVLAALLLFGRWSDALGRKPLLLAGLAASALSDLVFLAAGSTALLLTGRVVSGLSAGVYVGTATAAVVEAVPATWPSARRRWAPLVATAANIGGLGLGPLVSGAVSEWLPHPLTASYAVHLVAALAVGTLLLGVPETVVRRPGARPAFQRPSVPAAARTTFFGASVAGFAGFAVCGLVTAVSGRFVAEAVADPSRLLVGFVAFLVFGSSVVAQVLLRGMPVRHAVNLGCVLLAAGSLVLVAAVRSHELWLLVLAIVVAGAGQGLSFSKGLATLLSKVAPHERAGVSSAFFVVAYVAISLPVVGEGLAARRWGLDPSGTAFALAVGVLTLLALAVLVYDQRVNADPV